MSSNITLAGIRGETILMDKPTKPVAFSLSQEELFVVLRYLQRSDLLGLNKAVIDELNEAQQQLVLSIAERAMVARGFISPTQNQQMALIPAVRALVGICATPEQSVIVTVNRPENLTEILFFHQVREFLVSHTIPMSSIHQFIQMKDKQAVAQVVSSLMSSLPDSSNPFAPFELPQTVISQAREAAAVGQAEAMQVLSQTALPPNMRQSFAASLAAMEMSLALMVFSHQSDDENSADGFTLLHGNGSAWWLRPITDGQHNDHEAVLVKPISKEDAILAARNILFARL